MFRIVIIALVLTAFSISGYFRRRADRTHGEQISRSVDGSFISVALRLGGAVGILSVIGYLINPRWFAWAAVPMPNWVRWLGVATGVANAALLFWMFKSLGTNITPTSETRRDHELVLTGPYRFIRHPLYTFGSLFWLSIAVIAANWWIAAVWLTAFVVLAARTGREEEKLVERFGDDYREYMKRTGRYLPKIG